ncbi:MAG: hypothetical protein ABEK75_05410 [Salinibacter sp.]
MRPANCVLSLMLVALLAACGPTTEVLKLPDASEDLTPVPPGQIEVYRSPDAPRCEYDRVAMIEAQESESVGLTGGVSQIDLMRAAREDAGKMGANAIVIEEMGTEQFTETEVEADTSEYERTESRKQLGQAMFLAIREHRPCKTDGGP